MIKQSALGGSITVTIVSEVKVIGVNWHTEEVILETMGERRTVSVGNSLDLAVSGIFNLGGNDA